MILQQSGSHKALVRIHLAVFLFGFAGLFGKFLSCDPFYIVFGRTAFAAMALVSCQAVAATGTLSIDNREQLIFYIMQGILLAIHWWTFFVSIQVSSVAVGLITFSTFPLFVTFLEPFFFNERLKKTDVATAVVVFIGIVLVIPDLNFNNHVTIGGFFGILSGLTFSLLALVNRKNAQNNDPIAVAFYQNLFAAIFLIFPLVLLKPSAPHLSDIPALFFLGVVCTALSHTLFISSLSRIRAQTASVIAGLEPVYGIILAYFLLSEAPGFKTLIGGIIIIAATISAGLKPQ